MGTCDTRTSSTSCGKARAAGGAGRSRTRAWLGPAAGVPQRQVPPCARCLRGGEGAENAALTTPMSPWDSSASGARSGALRGRCPAPDRPCPALRDAPRRSYRPRPAPRPAAAAAGGRARPGASRPPGGAAGAATAPRPATLGPTTLHHHHHHPPRWERDHWGGAAAARCGVFLAPPLRPGGGPSVTPPAPGSEEPEPPLHSPSRRVASPGGRCPLRLAAFYTGAGRGLTASLGISLPPLPSPGTSPRGSHLPPVLRPRSQECERCPRAAGRAGTPLLRGCRDPTSRGTAIPHEETQDPPPRGVQGHSSQRVQGIPRRRIQGSPVPTEAPGTLEGSSLFRWRRGVLNLPRGVPIASRLSCPRGTVTRGQQIKDGVIRPPGVPTSGPGWDDALLVPRHCRVRSGASRAALGPSWWILPPSPALLHQWSPPAAGRAGRICWPEPRGFPGRDEKEEQVRACPAGTYGEGLGVSGAYLEKSSPEQERSESRATSGGHLPAVLHPWSWGSGSLSAPQCQS